MSADDMQQIIKKNWWMCVKAIASQTWDVFETQYNISSLRCA